MQMLITLVLGFFLLIVTIIGWVWNIIATIFGAIVALLLLPLVMISKIMDEREREKQFRRYEEEQEDDDIKF